jgi:hypothetical protein
MGEPMKVRAVTGAKAVGSFVPRLTKKAFERYGFPASELLTNWQAVVGADLARWTRPEKLKWPKAPDEEGERVPASGATLVLRIDGPRSIEVQMRARQIMERINAYFGFRAVTQLRIIQAPLPVRAEPERLEPAVPARPPVDVSAVADAGLRAALLRMSRGVAGKSR